MNKPIIVGLTGGIGSGKSTCAAVFELLGIAVYYADSRAKALYVEDDTLKEEVKELLGDEAYQANRLNRAYVGGRVFEDPKLLKDLERLVHPKVKKDFDKWRRKNAESPYLLREAAILLESGSYTDCDKIICVVADKGERLRRVIKRDNVTEKEVLARMEKQWSDSERISYSDYVIKTDGEESVIEQIRNIHSALLST